MGNIEEEKMIKNNIAEIDEFSDPKTSKLKSLKKAKRLGCNIPETLVVKNIFKLEQSLINEFALKGWLLRECLTNKMFGQEIPTSEIVHTKELFFQKLIPSEFSGNAWSYDGNIYIESIIGIGYGLNRGGFTPTNYFLSSVDDKREVVKQDNEYEIKEGKLILKKCGKYSNPPSSVIKELAEISKLFPNEMIEWAYANKKLFFLESYNYPSVTKHSVEGCLDENSKIIFLPRAELVLWPKCKDKEAIIIREGGYSSHLAVLCGIFGKPIVRYQYSILKDRKIKVKYAKIFFIK